MQDKILEIISEIYDEIIEKEDKNLKLEDYGLDIESLKPYLKDQKRLLIEFVEDRLENKNQFSIENCRRFYQELEIPYIVIDFYIKKLKRELINKLLNFEEQRETIINIENIFDDMLNLISSVFLKKEINRKKDIDGSKFAKFPLYKVHLEWSKKIFDFLLKEDFKSFPKENAKNCAFTKMMEYPESLMVCMEATLCGQLKLLHEILHNNAEALYRLIVEKEYEQAIFVFNEFYTNLQKFHSLLKDLYHVTHIDLENSFFKLIEILEYKDKNLIVSIIDIQELKKLNTKYGETELNNVLKEIEKFLEAYFRKDPAESLVIRGVSSNFYLLSLNKDTKKFETEMKNLLKDLKEHLKNKFPNYKIPLNIASFEFEKNTKFQKHELIRILIYLKEKSKQNQGIYFAYTKEEQEEIKKWLKEHYYNIQYVENKLNSKMVDIMLQPIFTKNGKEIYAYEALARLKDGDKLIPAEIFIDTVYQIGRITDLDKLVLEAILEKKDWILRTGKKLFINKSPLSLKDKGYLEVLANFIKIYGKDNLLIEITEQQALENFDILENLHKTHKVKFVIDDFGSSYSSLKTLVDMVSKELIDILKIDGSLIVNLDKEEEAQKNCSSYY